MFSQLKKEYKEQCSKYIICMINNNSLNTKNHELIRYRTYHASSGLVTSISQSHGPKHGPYIN